MKIILVNVTGGIPLGLAYLAAVVEEHDIRILECDVDAEARERIVRTIHSERPDIVGATVYTCHVNDAIEIMKAVKEVLPDTTTIAGGPHPTALPDTIVTSEFVDLVVRGEGEITFRELVDKMAKGEDYRSVEGIAYQENGEMVLTAPRGLIPDMDLLPQPAWDLMPIDTYKHPTYGHPRMNKPKFINMLATRGCPFRCAFCGAADVWGRRIRMHSPERIANEMRILQDTYGVHTVRFADSTFTVDRKWVLKLCDLLVDIDLDVAWSCNARADTLDEELLVAMRRAKCTSLTMGVESGDDEVLRIARKKQTVEQVREAFRLMKKTGMFSWGFFMIGLPGETPETIEKTIAFAEELDPDQVSVAGFAIPYPGTELYELASDEMGVVDFPWEDFHHSRKVLYVPKGLTKEQVEEGRQRFIDRLRPHTRQEGRTFAD